jgi:hypothetical protein
LESLKDRDSTDPPHVLAAELEKVEMDTGAQEHPREVRTQSIDVQQKFLFANKYYDRLKEEKSSQGHLRLS